MIFLNKKNPFLKQKVLIEINGKVKRVSLQELLKISKKEIKRKSKNIS